MSSPMFARRHYVALAGLIEGRMSELGESDRELIADLLAELFQSDNYRFKPSRFYAAAGVVPPWDRLRHVQEENAIKSVTGRITEADRASLRRLYEGIEREDRAVRR
jgi:hypothetical protein